MVEVRLTVRLIDYDDSCRLIPPHEDLCKERVVVVDVSM